MLKGEKVVLRPLSVDDYKKTLIWRNDPEIKRMMLEREGIDTLTLFRKKRQIKTPL